MDATSEELRPLMIGCAQPSHRNASKIALVIESLLAAAGFASSLVVAIVCTTSTKNWYSFGVHTSSGWPYYLIAGCFCVVVGAALLILIKQRQTQSFWRIAVVLGAPLLALVVAEMLALFFPTDVAWGPLAVPFGETQTKLVWYTGEKTAADIAVDVPVSVNL